VDLTGAEEADALLFVKSRKRIQS